METHYGQRPSDLPPVPSVDSRTEYEPKHRGEYQGNAVDIARRNRKNVIPARHSNEPGTYTPPPLTDPERFEDRPARRDLTIPLEIGSDVR